MNAKQTKIIAALQAELDAATATRDMIECGDEGAEELFDAACSRIIALQHEIAFAGKSRSKGYRCPNLAALVAANVD